MKFKGYILLVLGLLLLGSLLLAQRGNIPTPRPRGLTDGYDVLTVTLAYSYDDSIGEFVFSSAGITGVDGGVEAGEFVIHDEETYHVHLDGLSPSFKTFADRVHAEAFANYKARRGY